MKRPKIPIKPKVPNAYNFTFHGDIKLTDKTVPLIKYLPQGIPIEQIYIKRGYAVGHAEVFVKTPTPEAKVLLDQYSLEMSQYLKEKEEYDGLLAEWEIWNKEQKRFKQIAKLEKELEQLRNNQ